ncbi:MAG: nucleotidyl transferase AbiEii/AbiGii toxin family protein [Candidatus Auribacterota bacterium]|nr:nucleotidyl transferase AbiEii/AbiGii toxin family protein [Candidatus Auribacterota bacterium]
MFEEVLPGKTKAILALLGKSETIRDAYLAGGTALALQLGHRISYDLDFFTPEEFDEQMLLPRLKKIADFRLEKIAWRTILGRYNDVLFSIFYYKYPLLYPVQTYNNIRIIDTRDIAAMKIAAVAARGVKRDFIDLYFICRDVISLYDAIKLYDDKYENLSANAVHIIKSLNYFDDAEEDEMPHMLKEVKWDEVKKFFRAEVMKISKSLLL